MKPRAAAMIVLKVTLVTAADGLRAELQPLTDHQLIRACAALESSTDMADPNLPMRHVLRSLG